VPFQIADLSIGILWVLAMTSLMIYAIVLAGWSSGSNYPLLGGVRSSAQMISYEVGMSLAIVAVIMYSDALRMSEIVASQDKIWNVVPQFPAFVIYLIAGLAETNRPPFDLPEAETELVAGYHTEYSGIKFAMFYLGEYLNTITVAAVATTLWLGGWRGPAPDVVPWLWPLLWFLLKVLVIVYAYIWIRATLPRIRYDRLMAFGWKLLIPFGLAWVLLTGAIIVLPEEIGRRATITAFAIGFGALVVVSLIWPLIVRRPEAVRAR
jgi:NADH-quinone oxidoreductase subunit H